MKTRFVMLLFLLLSACAAPTTPPPPASPTARVAQVTNTPVPQPLPTKTPTRVPPTSRPSPTFTPRPPDTATVAPTTEPTFAPTVAPTTRAPAAQNDPVMVGAGDIAVCKATGDEATAAIVEKVGGTIFTLGDNVYENGTPEEFQNCYEPSWGRFKNRTHPVPGNHEYNTPNGSGYYGYFGERAGDPDKGYYSYDVGAWHVIALNSEINTGADSAQAAWLRQDLAATDAKCVVALFHRPLFSSGPHGRDGSGDKTRPLWDVLYENNADVILNGHDHDYERFAPQSPNGERDNARGIRQFVVGTGGASPYVFGNPRPNSEKRITGAFGVIKLTLHVSSYDWEFISFVPLLFSDRGSGECH